MHQLLSRLFESYSREKQKGFPLQWKRTGVRHLLYFVTWNDTIQWAQMLFVGLYLFWSCCLNTKVSRSIRFADKNCDQQPSVFGDNIIGFHVYYMMKKTTILLESDNYLIETEQSNCKQGFWNPHWWKFLYVCNSIFPRPFAERSPHADERDGRSLPLSVHGGGGSWFQKPHR